MSAHIRGRRKKNLTFFAMVLCTEYKERKLGILRPS